MSNLQNEEKKENLFDELTEYGYTEEEIIEYDMVNKIFFEEATIDEWSDLFREGVDIDGDHASALASAGFGTDEDYGDYGYDS